MKRISAYGLKITVFNFMIVALVGSLMRYKIVFSLPFFEQKNLLDAHSHFAFYGWITSAIYILILMDIQSKIPNLKKVKYIVIWILNLIGSYGMLIAFTYNDYYWLSILFSTLSLLCSWAFWIFLYFDIRKKSISNSIWYTAGLFFSFISSAGVFYIGYLTGTKQITQETLNASIFYYLHFQYNGFFIFACLGLFFQNLKNKGIILSKKSNKRIFYSMFISCLTGYGLSLLWMDLPFWMYIIIVLGTLIQTYAIILLINFFRKNWNLIQMKFGSFQTWVLLFVGFAFLVKIFLQQISIFPFLSKFAFDFRPVAIAYLHLILLMGISTFLLNQIIYSSYFKKSVSLIQNFKFYLVFIFANQIILGISGFTSIFHYSIPFEKLILFITGILIWFSLVLIFMKLKFHKEF